MINNLHLVTKKKKRVLLQTLLLINLYLMSNKAYKTHNGLIYQPLQSRLAINSQIKVFKSETRKIKNKQSLRFQQVYNIYLYTST